MELLGLGLAILGIALTVWSVHRARNRPRPCFVAAMMELIKGDRPSLPHGVEILYEGRVVSALVKSYVLFWNRGSQTLDASNLVAADPLRLTLRDGGEILRARVVRRTRDVNQVESVIAGDGVRLTYDFLDEGDGAVIEVLHTKRGKLPRIEGTIKGVRGGVEKRGILPPPATTSIQRPPLMHTLLRHPMLLFRERFARLVFGLSVAILGLGVVIAGLFVPEADLTLTTSQTRVALFVVGAVYGVLGLLVVSLSTAWGGPPKELLLEQSDIIG